MAEIVWKRGAEDDLLHIFAGLEDFRAGSGETFTLKLDAVLQNLRSHPGLAPVFEQPMRRLVVGNTGYGVFYTTENRGIIIHALIHLSQRRHPGENPTPARIGVNGRAPVRHGSRLDIFAK